MQRQQTPEAQNIDPLVATLARLHAALFDATPEAMAHSAELRAKAAEVVDRISGRRSKDVEVDWRLAETYLIQAYFTAVTNRAEKEDHLELLGDNFPSDNREEGYRR